MLAISGAQHKEGALVTHRSIGSADPHRLRGLTTRSRRAILNGVVALVTATALGLTAASSANGITCCRGSLAAGPHVVAASSSRGRLNEALTFHKAGQFVAHILFRQPTHLPLRGRTVALGHQAAGKSHIGFKLGDLKPGGYAVVITPEHQTTAGSRKTAATWVLFTVTKAGKVTDIRLVAP
jgi:hypothetical protein